MSPIAIGREGSANWVLPTDTDHRIAGKANAIPLHLLLSICLRAALSFGSGAPDVLSGRAYAAPTGATLRRGLLLLNRSSGQQRLVVKTVDSIGGRTINSIGRPSINDDLEVVFGDGVGLYRIDVDAGSSSIVAQRYTVIDGHSLLQT